jgi:hypothetical protein
MYSNDFKCSVNPSNLIAPVTINPKFHNTKLNPNSTRNNITKAQFVEITTDFEKSYVKSKTPAYIFRKNEAFPSIMNGYIKPLVSPFRYGKDA